MGLFEVPPDGVVTRKEFVDRVVDVFVQRRSLQLTLGDYEVWQDRVMVTAPSNHVGRTVWFLFSLFVVWRRISRRRRWWLWRPCLCCFRWFAAVVSAGVVVVVVVVAVVVVVVVVVVGGGGGRGGGGGGDVVVCAANRRVVLLFRLPPIALP